MKTILEKIDAGELIQYTDIFVRAADIIKKGGLVAFPTETVYGLGANALEPSAVRRIYEAKGRPSDNPMIVHLAESRAIEPYVKNVTLTAERLMNTFWPGPLTLLFHKTALIPLETSGGLNTVAIRVPIHPVARLLIESAGCPLAAPSANSSGKPSPTRASHVLYDLNGKIDMILDGGASGFGLESTIVDLTEEIPILLRPGAVTREMLMEVVGELRTDPSLTNPDAGMRPRAPGMRYTHYSPKARVTVVLGALPKVTEKILKLSDASKGRVGILATEQTKAFYSGTRHLVLSVGDRNNLNGIAANLFRLLRKFDYFEVDEVYAEGFPEEGIGAALMNRLKKAAGYRIVEAGQELEG